MRLRLTARDPTESYGFDEDWQDTMKSDSALNEPFALLKMPYHGTNEETAKKILRHGTRAFRINGLHLSEIRKVLDDF